MKTKTPDEKLTPDEVRLMHMALSRNPDYLRGDPTLKRELEEAYKDCYGTSTVPIDSGTITISVKP